MRKLLPFLLFVVVLAACNSDKKQIQNYLDRNYSDREVEVVGDVSTDSAFCPLTQLEGTTLEIMAYRAQLMMLLDQDPDSAVRLATAIKQKYADENTFANLAYPSGSNNRVAYRVRCNEAGDEHYITFYKNTKDETIEYSSFDVEDVVDSLNVYYTLLMNGVNELVGDKNADSKTEKAKVDKDNKDNKKDDAVKTAKEERKAEKE